jgi:outer membrane protein TolC
MLLKLPLFTFALATGTVSARAQDVSSRSPLDSIAQVAVTRNLGARRSREQERQADAIVRQAQGLFLPTLAVDTRYSALYGVVNIGDFINPAYAALNQLTGRSSFPTNVDATLPLRQETKLRTSLPLFNGTIFANLAAAHSIRVLKGAERSALVRRLDAESRIAYLNWARAARAVEVWDATLPVLEENARVSQCLSDAGTATPDAVLRARAALADARQQRSEATLAATEALGALNLLLDQPADSPVRVLAEDALPSPPPITLAEALASSARREERAVAGAGIDGAHTQGRAATSAFLPAIAIAADYGVQGNNYRFDRHHDVATASVVVQLNLFNGGQDAARRESAYAASRGAELQRQEIERQLAFDVRTSYDAAQIAREALVSADARLAAARSAFRLVDRRYTEGAASHLEWSDARSQLTAAELNRLLTRYTLAARAVDLERAAALRAIQDTLK